MLTTKQQDMLDAEDAVILGGTLPTAQQEQLEKASPLTIKEDYRLNDAQSLMFAMGLRPELLFAHRQETHYSHTKKGPGRTHKQGT